MLYEQGENKWQYYEPGEIQDEKDKRKLNSLGVKNLDDMARAKKVEGTKPGMFSAKQPNVNVA